MLHRKSKYANYCKLRCEVLKSKCSLTVFIVEHKAKRNRRSLANYNIGMMLELTSSNRRIHSPPHLFAKSQFTVIAFACPIVFKLADRNR